VTAIFITGNNQAAEGARHELEGKRTCFTLATKADDADAVLAIDASTQSEGSESGGLGGGFGGRHWIVSGTLTLKSGDLVWSHSERFMDAPFKSGGKTAGSLLIRHLADAASCKER